MKTKIILITFFITSFVGVFASTIDQADLQKKLQQAIINDNADRITQLVKEGATTNFPDESQSPLLRAILLKKLRAVRALLLAGSNPAITYLDQKIVHYVVKQGDFPIATLLIDMGADFSGIVDQGQDIFTYVSTHFNLNKDRAQIVPFFEEIIKRGYDLESNFNNKDLSNNAWYQVIKNNRGFYIEFFLNWGGSEPKKRGTFSLPHIANVNQIFTLPDGSTITPLLLAIQVLRDSEKESQEGGSSLLGLLKYGKNLDLNQKAMPDGKKTQSPLSYFLDQNAQTKKNSIIRLITEIMNRSGNFAEAIDLFIKNGGSPDHTVVDEVLKTKVTLLGFAVQYNNINAVDILMVAFADINKPTDALETTRVRGTHTPLYFALNLHETAIADILIKNGAHV